MVIAIDTARGKLRKHVDLGFYKFPSKKPTNGKPVKSIEDRM